MTDITIYTLFPLIFTTIFWHEAGVILWFRALESDFGHWTNAAAVTLVIVSVIDFFWLKIMFFLFHTSFQRIGQTAWSHRIIARLEETKWFLRFRGFFVKKEIDHQTAEIPDETSGFKRFIKKTGYWGILFCGSLPGPGVKEIGIIMALTPKYRDRGFMLMYIGGVIKTIMTMLVYGGLYNLIEHYLRNQIAF